MHRSTKGVQVDPNPIRIQSDSSDFGTKIFISDRIGLDSCSQSDRLGLDVEINK